MRKSIFVPGWFSPIHLWHEEFIEKIVSKTNKDLYFSIKWWQKIINEVSKLNEDWHLDKVVKRLKIKNNFLDIQEILLMFRMLYPNFSVWNETRNEIIWSEFDWIALWSDQFLKIIDFINLWKLNKFPFNKIYLFKRKWFPVWNYDYVSKFNNFDIEVIDLWHSSYDISSSKIIELYYKNWLENIKNMISKPVYDFIQNRISSKN